MDKTISLSMNDITPVITQCIEKGSEVILTVSGYSMSPFVKNRRDQVVLVKTDSPDKLKVGDVPLYLRENGMYVLHRVVKVSNGVYTMLGDAQTLKEPGIKPSQIIAVAKAFIRKGKRYECSGAVYRLYSFLWMTLAPVRNLIFKAYRFLKKIIKKPYSQN